MGAIAIALPINGVSEDWFRNEEGAMGTGVGTTVVVHDRCGGGSEMEAAAKETERGNIEIGSVLIVLPELWVVLSKSSLDDDVAL